MRVLKYTEMYFEGKIKNVREFVAVEMDDAVALEKMRVECTTKIQQLVTYRSIDEKLLTVIFRTLDATPKMFQMILDNFHKRTGWSATLFATGPSPDDGGDLAIIT